MLPPLRLHLPPQTPSACSRQERARLSKWQRSARTRTRSHAKLANLGLTPPDCTVGTVLAFCGYATNEVDRDASMLQAHVHTHVQAHNVHTHAPTLTHAHAHTLTQSHRHTCAHTHTRTHNLSLAPLHTRTHARTHTSYSTQAARKASTRMQQQ